MQGPLSACCQRRDNVGFELRVQVVGGLDPGGQWRWLNATGRVAAEGCRFTVEVCALGGTLVGLECATLGLEWKWGSQSKGGPCLF